MLGAIAAFALFTRRPEASATSTLPVACARAYARAPTAADSAAVEGWTPSIRRTRGPGPNCGFYRGRARIDSLAARKETRPGN